MTRPDLAAMSPHDGVTAVRSFPRRYRDAFGDEDDERRDHATRVGPEGVSAMDLVVDTARSLAMLGGALEQIVEHARPTLHPGVMDAGQREWSGPPARDLDAALEELDHTAPELATQADRIHGGDWERSADLAGGGSVRAIEVLREAVRTGSDNLRQIERLVEE